MPQPSVDPAYQPWQCRSCPTLWRMTIHTSSQLHMTRLYTKMDLEWQDHNMNTSILSPNSPVTKEGTESTFSTHSAGLLIVTCGCLFLQLSLSTGVQDRAPGNTTQCIQRLASLVQGTWQHHTMYTGVYPFSTGHLATPHNVYRGLPV